MKYFNHVKEEIVESGRAIAVHLTGARGTLCIASVHVNPRLSPQDRCQNLSKLHRSLPHNELVIVAGDWNFCVPGEQRMHAHSTTPIARHEPEAMHFDNTFKGYVELAQDDFTHRVLEDGAVRSVSRLDRIYCNMPQLDLLDSRPTTTIC